VTGERFDPSSRSWLSPHDLARFPDDTLFHHVARLVCEAHCLPRKELFEAWNVARRVRRRIKGGRVVDLACGHALTASLLLLIDDTSESALAVDQSLPRSASKLLDAMSQRFPRLRGRIELAQRDLMSVPLHSTDLVVSVHGCGSLTDVVIERAQAAQASLAVLPCCHDRGTCDTGGLEPWMDVSLAIDATRALKLRQSGYDVHTQTIPGEITPKNRLIIAKLGRG